MTAVNRPLREVRATAAEVLGHSGCRTQNLERHTAQHGRAVDLEAASLDDQSVRGPLSYYTAVVEVVGECGLR